MISKVSIKVFPRLHISLIGMNSSGYRINGGIGFSINKPNLFLKITPSKEFELIDDRSKPFTKQEIERIAIAVCSTILRYGFKTNVFVYLNGEVPTHSGLGSGTVVRLGVIEALFKINNEPYTNEDIVSNSGRGKTSGIGVRTYFNGGFVMDVGHKADFEEILPSSKREQIEEDSLLLIKGKVPEWIIGLCIPSFLNSITSEDEKRFFESTVPIENESVYETLYHCIYGIVSSLLENDISTFNEACTKIQKTEWKQKERSLYKRSLEKLENDLIYSGADTVGMSSLGPTLFFTGANIEYTLDKMKTLYGESVELIKVKANNKGRIMRCLS